MVENDMRIGAPITKRIDTCPSEWHLRPGYRTAGRTDSKRRKINWREVSMRYELLFKFRASSTEDEKIPTFGIRSLKCRVTWDQAILDCKHSLQ